MKFEGIIPELKFSEGSNQLGYFIEMLEPYPIVSVNTSSLFGGDISFIESVREKYPDKFIIRKDFIMVPKQIEESRQMGADAVLIIRDFLTSKQYDELIFACRTKGVIPLTEVHNRYCEDAWKIRDPILVNSRNLNTGEFNKNQAIAICKAFKEGGKNVIYASGENSDKVVKEGIADAVLIGTAFMRGELNG